MNTQTELQPAFPVFTTVYQYIIIIKKTQKKADPCVQEKNTGKMEKIWGKPGEKTPNLQMWMGAPTLCMETRWMETYLGWTLGSGKPVWLSRTSVALCVIGQQCHCEPTFQITVRGSQQHTTGVPAPTSPEPCRCRIRPPAFSGMFNGSNQTGP